MDDVKSIVQMAAGAPSTFPHLLGRYVFTSNLGLPKKTVFLRVDFGRDSVKTAASCNV